MKGNYNAAFAQVNRINSYAADGHLLSYTSYNVNSATGQTDCPRFTERRDWAENWNNNNEALTSYSVAADNSWAQMTAPDTTIYKEFFAISGWQNGLPTTTEIWSQGVKKKWTTISWTQDDTGLSYQKNARVTETNVYDAEGNRRRVAMTYYPTTSFSLPMATYEYAADGITLLRRTHTNYNLSSTYTDRRIIGLPTGKYVFDGNNTLYKFDVFDYDYGGSALIATPQPAVQHDPAYGISFLAGRGNLSLVRRADVINSTQWQDTVLGYNTTGSLVSITDPLSRQTTISYNDSYSDAVNRNTFAYPTTITDPGTFASTIQYNYDFGPVTRTQDPKGAVQTITYDGAARTDRITNQISGAYLRYFYATNGSVATYSTNQNGAGEAYAIDYFDGAGRVFASSADHPGSSGGYAARFIFYDVMGRVSQWTNPAEIDANGTPVGDDAAGWVSSLQTYDWSWRPLKTTNPDGSYRETAYGGCGCAGGETITVRDENGRRKRYTKDVLSRLVKVEEMEWNGSTVYSTTNYTPNTRDQLTSINQAGQIRSFVYDGYGRLQSRTTPEQGPSTYTYFADDAVQTITDARGATTTFAYNTRGLPTSITYGVPSGVAATPNVSFEYDSAGNRTSMTDGLGSASYVYNTMSQMTSETRTFTGVGSYTLNYGYNLGGQLNSITNQWGTQVGYGYDKVGRLTNVSGSGYAGVSSYISSMAYRAFGLKQMGYSNGRTLSLQYDNRLRPTQWSIPGVLRMEYRYDWEKSGRVEFVRNLDDETLDRYYAYDQVGRLIASRSGNEARLAIGEQVPLLYNGPYSHNYHYDEWGNITAREGWGGENPAYTATYTNNKRAGMTYDSAGNLTNDGGQNFTYDATGQAATAGSTGYLLQQNYDGNGMRVKKIDNGATTYYLRSSVLGGQVVAEIGSGGAFQRGYVYLGGQLLAVQQQNAVSWVHQDPVAKSQRVTNSSGNVVSTIELDPWGGNTNRSNNDAFQPRKFTTYERDGNGSDEAMFRRYNRWWSRFDQPDPYDGSYNLADPQSFNRYAYVQNDPVNVVDPLGLDPEGGVLGGWLGEVAGMGPGTSIVDVFIDGGFGGIHGDGGELVMALHPEKPVISGEPAGPQNPTPTDCHRFAALVAEIAGRNDTAEGFMDEMARTFTAANNSSRAEIRRNLDGVVPPGRTMLGEGGFRDSLRDGTGLQVRHFVGGLLYGYRYGYGTMIPATALEAISPAPAGSMADVRLNEFSMRWGAGMEPKPARYVPTMGSLGGAMYLGAHSGYRGLADLIRRDICQ